MKPHWFRHTPVPRKKAVFERLCAEEDQTPSQVVRRLMREYIEKRLGRPWAAKS